MFQKRPASNQIQREENKIAKLEEIQMENCLIGNPGFSDINQTILSYMDHQSQMAFRQVCQSWKEEVDQPLFWIKKLNLESYPKGLGNVWIDLVGRIQKGSDLEKEATECLMKWYGKHQSYIEESLKGMSPTHIAAIFECTNIAMFVASYLKNVNAPRSDGVTPLQIAAQYGSTEIFKFLAPQVKNPNAPAPNGWTALHIAAYFGSTGIFKFLAPQMENPNSPRLPDGRTPLKIATQFNQPEIVSILLKILSEKVMSNSEAIMNTL